MSPLKKSLAAYARVVTKRQAAARGLTVYPDDTFLVSFPRSGNTWVRFLVCNLINPDDAVDFARLESRIPEIYDLTDRALREDFRAPDLCASGIADRARADTRTNRLRIQNR